MLGRPRENKDHALTEQVTIRLTQPELQLLQQVAKERDVPVGRFIRYTLRKELYSG